MDLLTANLMLGEDIIATKTAYEAWFKKASFLEIISIEIGKILVPALIIYTLIIIDGYKKDNTQ